MLASFPCLASALNLTNPKTHHSSISSSPLVDKGKLTLTYSVLNAPAHSGMGRHVGVASSYLSSLMPGDKLQASVRPAAGGFRLPPDPLRTPMICIAAGTGLAPFRAFIQERAVLLRTSAQTPPAAPALLFYGCRDPDQDDLYRDELDAWEAAGAVVVYRAFSRRADASGGCSYVQDRLWREREAVGELWRRDARVYICGAGRMAGGVKEVLVRIMQSEGERMGSPISAEEGMAWFDKHRNERFATDVFD